MTLKYCPTLSCKQAVAVEIYILLAYMMKVEVFQDQFNWGCGPRTVTEKLHVVHYFIKHSEIVNSSFKVNINKPVYSLL